MGHFIFINCIANGPVNWKLPLTGPGQPGVREAFMIVTHDGEILDEKPFGGEMLALYSHLLGQGFTAVGHSVDYHHGHLRAEMISRGTDPIDGRTKTICTMLGLTGHVPKRNGKKGWPTFDEACDFFCITRAGVETAEDNARCLAQVWRGMEAIGVEPETRIWKERKRS